MIKISRLLLTLFMLIIFTGCSSNLTPEEYIEKNTEYEQDLVQEYTSDETTIKIYSTDEVRKYLYKIVTGSVDYRVAYVCQITDQDYEYISNEQFKSNSTSYLFIDLSSCEKGDVYLRVGSSSEEGDKILGPLIIE